MRDIIFEWQKGFGEHNKVKEVVSYNDAVTDKEIESDFQEWVWNCIGDAFTWYEK